MHMDIPTDACINIMVMHVTFFMYSFRFRLISLWAEAGAIVGLSVDEL